MIKMSAQLGRIIIIKKNKLWSQQNNQQVLSSWTNYRWLDHISK